MMLSASVINRSPFVLLLNSFEWTISTAIANSEYSGDMLIEKVVNNQDDKNIARRCVLCFPKGVNSVSKKTFTEEMEFFVGLNTYSCLEDMGMWQKYFHMIHDAAIELGNREVAAAYMRWRLTGKF